MIARLGNWPYARSARRPAPPGLPRPPRLQVGIGALTEWFRSGARCQGKRTPRRPLRRSRGRTAAGRPAGVVVVEAEPESTQSLRKSTRGGCEGAGRTAPIGCPIRRTKWRARSIKPPGDWRAVSVGERDRLIEKADARSPAYRGFELCDATGRSGHRRPRALPRALERRLNCAASGVSGSGGTSMLADSGQRIRRCGLERNY